MHRRAFCRLAASPLVGVTLAASSNGRAGSFEATSLLDRKLFALSDDDAVRTARDAFRADPHDVELALKLSKAYAARRQYREAIETCSAALRSKPESTELYLERGHRELGLREFKRGVEDLSRAVTLDRKNLDAHYHLGMGRYFLRQFSPAAEAFGSALALAQTSDSLIDCSNWAYVSLRRAQQPDAAARVLAPITPDIKNTEPHLYFYLRLLHFYQGKLSESELVPTKPTDPSDVEAELSFNTISYGVGNWYLYNRHSPAHAQEFFQRVVSGAAWNSWGFIGSELELAAKRSA